MSPSRNSRINFGTAVNDRLTRGGGLPERHLMHQAAGNQREGITLEVDGRRSLTRGAGSGRTVVHPGQRTGEATFVGLEHIEPNSGRRTGSSPIDLGSLTGRKPISFRQYAQDYQASWV